MKKLLFVVVMLLAAVSVQAQQLSFKAFFDRYTEREGFTSVELGRKMMQSMSQHSRQENRSLAKLLDGIVSIRIVVADEFDREFIAAARAVADQEPYKLMSSLTEDGQVARFYFVDANKNGLSEFLMISYGSQETAIVDVYGRFDVTEVSRLSSLRPQ